jgi:hypothetical protein
MPTANRRRQFQFTPIKEKMMKQVLSVLVLVAVGVVGLGFYLGWFHVDTNKIKEDETTAVAKVKDVEHQIHDKVVGPNQSIMDGKVVSVSADKLTMTGKVGMEHSHPLAATVHVTCDGKVCVAADLKAGMRIRVTSDSAAPHTATQIEALNNNADFAKGG